MRISSSASLTRDLQSLFDTGTSTGLTDRQLLERFLSGSEAVSASAFEAIVLRHGPMVLRVCKARLRDWNDAQDAFQATFLIMVKRARSIKRRESFASWLYGVAQRVANRASVDSARRKAIEGQKPISLAVTERPAADAQVESLERSNIVHQEVTRLPENYRAVIVLCYWEAMTQEQAAAHLGCPLGTVRSRMARGKEMLKKRLSRRGLAPGESMELEGLLGASVAGSSAIPGGLLTAVVKAGSELAGGRSLIDITSASVALLAERSLRSMVMIKLKSVAICLGILSVGALGVGMAGPKRNAERPKKAPDRIIKTAKQKAQPPLESESDYRVNPPDMLVIEVLEALPGRPIGGERLIRPDGKISLGFYGEIYVAGLTVLEVKEKVIQHLQKKFLQDETLGLEIEDPETGEPIMDKKTKQPKLRDPKESDRVFVDVTAYNSRNFYIQGEVVIPGRLPVTGSDRVLDAIDYAGGLTSRADHTAVTLHRPKQDGTTETLPIDIDQLMLGDDLSTNYQLKAGDRLVVPADENAIVSSTTRSSPANATGPTSARGYFPAQKRRKEQVETALEAAEDSNSNRRSLEILERRLTTLEHKIDFLVKATKTRAPKAMSVGKEDQ